MSPNQRCYNNIANVANVSSMSQVLDSTSTSTMQHCDCDI